MSSSPLDRVQRHDLFWPCLWLALVWLAILGTQLSLGIVASHLNRIADDLEALRAELVCVEVKADD
jgi:hypothetical protein